MMDDLRAANMARQAEWPGNDKIDLAFRALEVAGEAGELAEAVENSLRMRALTGQGRMRQRLCDELGDLVIAADLLAQHIGFKISETDVSNAVRRLAFASDSPSRCALAVAAKAGLVAEAVKKNQRAALGIKGSTATPDDIGEAIINLMAAAGLLASVCRINLRRAVAGKFNATSEKYELQTRLSLEG